MAETKEKDEILASHVLRIRRPKAAAEEPVTVLYNSGIGCNEATERSGAMSGNTKLIGSWA